MNIRTKLSGKSNAILIEVDSDGEDQVVAIIRCDKEGDLTNKVARAIKEHNIAQFVSITNKTVLTNQEPILINAQLTNDDGEKDLRNYTLHIMATY